MGGGAGADGKQAETSPKRCQVQGRQTEQALFSAGLGVGFPRQTVLEQSCERLESLQVPEHRGCQGEGRMVAWPHEVHTEN